ncbi:hypothetical protein [Massilia sp. DWR3-1-1]|uniref:hypothetical protein n=1 Tax=Massilia sp. DWR3-1-1 TaxID=2804559 RepID=UPI003CE673B5
MATDEDSPRAIIRRLLVSNADGAVDCSIEILELLANSLVGMIGEHGFETLLYRSAHRVNLDFPWLLYDPRRRPADPEFNLLRDCFDGQDAPQSLAASELLLTTLIDILAVLIGEYMTMLIVQPALNRASARNKSKEQDNG